MATFDEVLPALKDGKRIARHGWNGPGMFAYMVPAASYPVQTGAAKAHFGEGSLVPYRAYLALKTADNDVATWAPSASDVLADDWYVLAGTAPAVHHIHRDSGTGEFITAEDAAADPDGTTKETI